jgi:hypothetical protein
MVEQRLLGYWTTEYIAGFPHNSQHKIPGFFQNFFSIFKGDFRKSLAVFLTLERGLIHLCKAEFFAFNVAIYQNQT